MAQPSARLEAEDTEPPLRNSTPPSSSLNLRVFLEVAEALRKAENTGAGRMGAGRGEQGGPTAKQLADYEDKQNADIYTVSGKGPQPPTDPEGVRKSTKKYAKGGSVSSRADGIAQRGKTKGRFV